MIPERNANPFAVAAFLHVTVKLNKISEFKY